MLKSEKKSLIRFLLIYHGSTFLLFSIVTWTLYNSQKKHLLEQQRKALHFDAVKLVDDLGKLHKSDAPKLYYPVRTGIDSAIYDMDKNYIFGTGTKAPLLDEEVYQEDDCKLYYIAKVNPHYLGAAYILISKEINYTPITQLQQKTLLFLLGSGVVFLLLGLYLGKLFIAPMRESMKKMNLFIEDTTHELNTPISTILTNIEMLETFERCEPCEELQRIEIASKTLSRIYNDLTYLNLNHQTHRHIEEINISEFVKERMLYFKLMAEHKKLKVDMYIDDNVFLMIDKNDLGRLIDNLISNAIKYNHKEGSLTLHLTQELFSVSDTGIGIHQNALDTITCRFKRADKSEGGFGIGLDIVNHVVEDYGFTFDIHSGVGKGTKVVVKWQK